MKRTPIKRSTKPMKRTRLKQVSDKRKAVNKERRELLIKTYGAPSTWQCVFWIIVGAKLAEGVIDKDGAAFNAPQCYGRVDGHETLKRSRAGSTNANLLDMENIVLMCQVHNTWIENFPEAAHELGLADHAWER